MPGLSTRQHVRHPVVSMKDLTIAATAGCIPDRKRIVIHIGIMGRSTVIDMQERSFRTERVAVRSMDAIAVKKKEAPTVRSTAEQEALHPQPRRSDQRIRAHIRRATAPRKRRNLTPITYMITNPLRTSPMTNMKSSMIMRTTTRMRTRHMTRRRTTGTTITDQMCGSC